MEGTPTNSRAAGKTPSRTPINRAISLEPPSTRRSAFHTPLDRSVSRDLLNSVRRGTPRAASNNNAPTPHAKAARRALHDRRTAIFTPGKNRRRSQMEQRETPMDILRRLGSTLASKSKPISTSSSSSASSADTPQRPQRTRHSDFTASFLEPDDDDDAPLPKPPRLSLPFDEIGDDDEDELTAPRLSDVTMRSLEGPRRYDPDQQSAYLRESMGSIRGSDVFGNVELTGDMGRQSDFGAFDDLPQNTATGGDLERLDDPTVRPSLGQDSGFDFEMPQFGEPSETFRFSPPPMDAAATSPIVEHAEALNAGTDVPEPVEDISDREPMEDVSDREPLEHISVQGPEDLLDQEAIGDISDREPIEDISDRSDDGGIPVGDAFSDHGVEIEVTAPQRAEVSTRREAMPPRKKNRISRHGIEYPSLPPAFVKRVAQRALQSSGLSNPRISADTLTALTQASDWFFEQLGDDLGAYANHAKRKTVEESDVVTLMRRQRQIDSTSTMFSLAQKNLPRELLQELRMPVPQPTKKRRAKRPREDDEAEEVT